MQNLLTARKIQAEALNPRIGPFYCSQPAEKCALYIREKYRQAPKRLVDRLGECNWQRHLRVRNQSVENEIVHFPAFRPAATFHDSGILMNDSADAHYAQSHTSYVSSHVGSERNLMRASHTPKEVKEGQPFRCSYCCKTISNVKNRSDWKSVYDSSIT